MAKPARVYAVADTHFGHDKVITFRPWPTVEEHDRQIIARWNSVVRPRDVVWHLGDVYFGGRDNHTILAQLNGIKRLVMGNHDKYPSEYYLKYFDKVYGAYVYKGRVLMTHVPVHESQLRRFPVNIHGHLHDKRIEDPRYKCVSLEHHDYFPVRITELLEGMDDG